MLCVANGAAELALRLNSVHDVRLMDLQARQPSNYELKATSVLALPLTEVSAKVSINSSPSEAKLGIHPPPVWTLNNPRLRNLLAYAPQVSAGWPNDDKEDLDMPIWAGVLPLTQVEPASIMLRA